MLDFRKVFLGLAVAGLGLVGNASAQGVPQCGATLGAGFEGYVAVEGLTETLPGIVINCGATAPTTGTATYSGPVSFTLTSSVPFTNQTIPSSTNLDVAATDGTVADATAATVVQNGPTTITVTFPTVTAGTTAFTIAGLRVNASVAPVSSTITVGVTSATVQIVATQTSVNAAFVTKSLSAVTISSAAAATGSTLTANALSNLSACTITGTAAQGNVTLLQAIANVGFSGGFIDALKTATEVTNAAAAAGNNNPATPDAKAIAAKQSAVIAVTFSNLNTAGVNYYVPLTIGGAAFTLTATTGPNGTAAATAVASGAATGFVAVAQSGGTATAYYLVTNSTAPETVPTTSNGLAAGTGLVLYQVVPSVPAVTGYSTAPVAVSIVLNGTAAPGYPQYTTPTPYTATESGTANVGGLLQPCATTLLFPYVVNTGGFDTGVAITNASTGSGIPGVTTNTGSCVVTFYGTGAATATVVYNTGTIAAATDATFLVSAQAPGLSGYAVAVCNFLGAHGYAFVTDGFGGGGRGLSADYLAIVTTSGSSVLPLATF
jgi:hypothetical protein